MQGFQMGGQCQWDALGPPSRPEQLQPAAFEQDLNVYIPASTTVRCEHGVTVVFQCCIM